MARDLEHLLRPSTTGAGLTVFSTEPDAAQLVWSQLPEGRHRLVVDGIETDLEHAGGPGSVVLDPLTPSSEVVVQLHREDGARLEQRFRTAERPDGEELFRFATLSDLHLGRGDKQYRGPMAHPVEDEDVAGVVADESPTTKQPARPVTATHHDDRPLRCARAAIDEALAWGAQLIVIKGDVCEETYDSTWDLAAELLGELPVPLLMLPGNHDTGRERHFEPEHGAAQRGLRVTRGVEHLDVPGLRIVLVDSTIPGNGWGDVARHADEAAALSRDATSGVFLATHHQPQRFRMPLYWPHGIPGPNARRFARAVVAANPAAVMSSGHTHRNRRRTVAGLTWSEVAATNHYPGTWAGYRVFEGGLHQSVRRIAEPTTLAWSEQTRRMLGGTWALWSTGSLSDRSFSVRW